MSASRIDPGGDSRHGPSGSFRAEGRPIYARCASGAKVARPAQREDRPSRRALAGAAAGEGDAAPVVDPAGANPRAARPNTVAESTGREPAPLGSAPARLPAARGLALLEIEPAQATGAALGGRTPA